MLFRNSYCCPSFSDPTYASELFHLHSTQFSRLLWPVWMMFFTAQMESHLSKITNSVRSTSSNGKQTSVVYSAILVFPSVQIRHCIVLDRKQILTYDKCQGNFVVFCSVYSKIHMIMINMLVLKSRTTLVLAILARASDSNLSRIHPRYSFSPWWCDR